MLLIHQKYKRTLINLDIMEPPHMEKMIMTNKPLTIRDLSLYTAQDSNLELVD